MVLKAVIPVAGYGTRMFPVTAAFKKEFLPLVDKDGFPKPAIQFLVEEAVDAGIEEICLIVRPGDEKVFMDYFEMNMPSANEAKLRKNIVFSEHIDKLREISKRLKFAIQSEQKGFGHAVYQAKDFVGSNPFILMLGDQIYLSNVERSCTEQLIMAYNRVGDANGMIALSRASEDFVHLYGCASIKPPDYGNETEYAEYIGIDGFIEKPSISTAREKLVTQRLPRGFFFCVFGEYIFTGEIFEHLKYEIENNITQNGEFQLTTAMDRFCKQSGYFYGYETKGKYLDIGRPDLYAKAVSILAGEV